MLRINLTRLTGKYLIYGALASAFGSIQAAEFTFDFTASPGATVFQNIDLPSGTTSDGNDKTRVYWATVQIDGKQYLQFMIGDLTVDKIAHVSYTELRSSWSGLSFSPDFGGNERAYLGTQQEYDAYSVPGFMVGNATDPMGITVDPASGFKPYDLTGNGTGNPTRIVFRTIVSEGEMTLDVFKPHLGRKPLISQSVSGEAEMTFKADMRGIGYQEMFRPSEIVNRLSVKPSETAEQLPESGAASFDMKQAQKSNVTAGQYIFTPGGGYSAPFDPDGEGGWDVDGSVFDEGSYTYAGGDQFDVLKVDWASFFDYDQNKKYCTASGSNRKGAVCPE